MNARTKWLVVVGLVVAVAVVGGCRKSKPSDKAHTPVASQECREAGEMAAKAEPPTVRVIALKNEPAGAAAETVKELLRCEHMAGIRQQLSIAENEPANAIVLVGAPPIVDRLEAMVLDLDKAAGQRAATREAMNRPMADGPGQRPMPAAPARPEMLLRPGLGPMQQPGGMMMKPGLGMTCPNCGHEMICPLCGRMPMMGQPGEDGRPWRERMERQETERREQGEKGRFHVMPGPNGGIRIEIGEGDDGRPAKPGEAVKPAMPMKPGERFEPREKKGMEHHPDAAKPGAKKFQKKPMNDDDDDDDGELEVD